ncbi:conserved hypothetical protein [Frankia canadensis]|uniref:Uncharacterized protein n=1 Tax=Frankia canadensis TaxID=1836972 RepID=A0A2I2KLK2_9ACTN|nr:hypothetical protein [Frankia canadensis]SNQ46527.1 conserved hypothetical protein [Frankia canadensis]SOU53817.1 conserved hypothetical protein [Frankia canadensis]
MGTFILTWNPDRYEWDEEGGDYEGGVALIASGATITSTWSMGGRRHGVEPGDRFYLLRQGVEPRGIIGSGYFTTGEIYEDEHFSDPTRTTWYAKVVFELLIDPADGIPTAQLLDEVPGFGWNTTYASGNEVRGDAVDQLDRMWKEAAAHPKHRR